METSVERERFWGSCYQAANFQHEGTTQGRGRQDGGNEYALPVKDIYLYPLYPDVSKQLCEGQTKEVIEAKGVFRLGTRRAWECRSGGLEVYKETDGLRFLCETPGEYSPGMPKQGEDESGISFLDNKESKMEIILSSHYQSTMNRIKEEEVVLAVQDTTSLNYSPHPATENLGPIGSRGNEIIGLMVHDTMAFNLEGTPLGLVNVQSWARNIENYGKKHQRRKLPIEEKESNKWLVSFKSAAEIQKQCPKTVIVSVGDREADIYELFELALEGTKSPKLLVRAGHNRSLLNEQEHLWDYINSRPVSGIQDQNSPKRESPVRGSRISNPLWFSGIESSHRKTRKRKYKSLGNTGAGRKCTGISYPLEMDVVNDNPREYI